MKIFKHFSFHSHKLKTSFSLFTSFVNSCHFYWFHVDGGLKLGNLKGTNQKTTTDHIVEFEYLNWNFHANKME